MLSVGVFCAANFTGTNNHKIGCPPVAFNKGSGYHSLTEELDVGVLI